MRKMTATTTCEYCCYFLNQFIQNFFGSNLFFCFIFSTSFWAIAAPQPEVNKLLKTGDVIWGFDFLSPQKIIFTERGGALKTYDLTSKKVNTIKGSPKVWARGQGGLLDVRRHPKFSDIIYISYSKPMAKGLATTALGRGTLKNSSLLNFKDIFVAAKPNSKKIHFGSRIEFDGNDHIYLTVGDRNERSRSIDLNYHTGKTIRLNLDGSIPDDNPFKNTKEALSEIWSIGHRSPQGLVQDTASGNLWEAEMGPRGGDELNLIVKGKNYGWPEVTYGREYYGPGIGVKKKVGTVQPIAYWVPSISPSGMAFYRGKKYAELNESILLGCLSGEHIRVLKMSGAQVKNQVSWFKNWNQRIRNIRVGPDGYIYISTDSGILGRLVPAQAQ